MSKEWTLEQREAQRRRASARWDDPEKREIWVASMQGSHVGQTLSLEHRAALSRAQFVAQNRPEVKERMIRIKSTPEEREKMRQSRLRQRFPLKGTKMELLLEAELRKRRLKFEMHKPMFPHEAGNNSTYYWKCDFVFLSSRLIVEVDGEYWHSFRKESDAELARAASEAGWTMMRFPNSVVGAYSEACARAIARFVRSTE